MTELLFTREQALRVAACRYGADRTDENRKALRAAAIAYADTAREIDECFAEEVQP